MQFGDRLPLSKFCPHFALCLARPPPLYSSVLCRGPWLRSAAANLLTVLGTKCRRLRADHDDHHDGAIMINVSPDHAATIMIMLRAALAITSILFIVTYPPAQFTISLRLCEFCFTFCSTIRCTSSVCSCRNSGSNWSQQQKMPDLPNS
jgi:hypothetical protein